MLGKRRPKAMVILDLLIAHKAMYGLEMIDAAPKDLKQGTIYVTLARLEDKGWVKSSKTHDLSGARGYRRIYQITGEGRQARAEFEEAQTGQTKENRYVQPVHT